MAGGEGRGLGSVLGRGFASALIGFDSSGAEHSSSSFSFIYISATELIESKQYSAEIPMFHLPICFIPPLSLSLL